MTVSDSISYPPRFPTPPAPTRTSTAPHSLPHSLARSPTTFAKNRAQMNPLGSPHSVGGSFHVIPSHVYQSLIAGNSSPSSRNRESPMVNFSGIGPRRRREADEEDPEAEEEEEEGDLERQPEKKRRLTAAQVQYLEKSFEVENKLEPERKNQLAKELSLQPRQVAIWFQNRRARFKTKQLERDYADLKSKFESLKSDYDDLLKERDQLQNEVSMLRAELNLRKAGSSNSPTDAKPLAVEAAAVAVKLEEASSVKSDVFDSESPHSTSQAERPEFSHEDLTGSFMPVAEFGFGKAEEGGFDGGSCSGLGLTGLEGHPSYWPWLY